MDATISVLGFESYPLSPKVGGVTSLSLSFFTCKSVHPPGLMGGLKELPMNISARCLVQVTCSILSGHYHLDTQNVRTSQSLGGRESSLIS